MRNQVRFYNMIISVDIYLYLVLVPLLRRCVCLLYFVRMFYVEGLRCKGRLSLYFVRIYHNSLVLYHVCIIMLRRYKAHGNYCARGRVARALAPCAPISSRRHAHVSINFMCAPAFYIMIRIAFYYNPQQTTNLTKNIEIEGS